MILNWAFTFDATLDTIASIYKGLKEKVDNSIDFLQHRAIRKAGLLATAYDVRFGSMQEYVDATGPNAWIGIEIANYIEKFGDPGNEKLIFVKEIADALLGI